MKKNSANIFFGHLGESSSYFPNTAFDHGGAPIPLRIFVDHVAIFSSRLMQPGDNTDKWRLVSNFGHLIWA